MALAFWSRVASRIPVVGGPLSAVGAPRSLLLPQLTVGGGSLVQPGGLLTQVVRWKHGAKPKQAAKKRFRLLKGGDIARGKAGQRHNTGYRSSVRMSRLRVTAKVADSFVKRVRKLLTG